VAIPKNDVDDFFSEADAANDPPAAHGEDAWKARVVGVPTDWYAAEPPKRSWLLRDRRHPKARGVLPLGKVGQLIAEGGAGKTQALCQLAIAVATGGTWLGALEVAPAGKGRVLLVLGEEDAEESRRRLFRSARLVSTVPAPGAIEVLPLAGVPAALLALDEYRNLVDTPFAHWLRAYVAKGDFRLVVIDPLSRFAGPDAETDNASATRFIQSLEAACPALTSVLNAHHTNKLARLKGGRVEAAGGRGASAIVDGARWQCSLAVERLTFELPEEQARLGVIVTWDCTKSNYAARAEPIMLRSDADNGGALVALDSSDLEIVDRARTRSDGSEALRAKKADSKDTATRQRNADDDAAAREVMHSSPT
jgi:RecA-family ATPase